MLKVLQWVTIAVCALAVAGTLLSLSRSARWWVRVWDFPRLQIAIIAAAAGALYAIVFFDGGVAEWGLMAATAGCVLWQLRKIFPYTPIARTQVERSTTARPRQKGARDSTFRLLISNVQMENTRHALLLERVREADPDVVLAVETDEAWARGLEPLAKDYPHVVRHPRDNWYGLMLFSRLELVDPRVEFLVQDDIPSVHTGVRLGNGEVIQLHGLHPRPPEPLRDQDSTPRDAELVIVGRAVGEETGRPTVVAGDLNDVAWSPTSEHFMRLSRVLDPRCGRGFYNSYNAKNPIFRYPLDHVFHSSHFRLVELRRLESVGSDHFPMLIELSYEPDAQAGQPTPTPDGEDFEEVEEKLEEQAEAAATGDDRPGRE
ncbi:MAG TPA: endonuclease/exonuclease/phosphatase family protein [Longimicrobium sp.]|nr:endonuclease/exonuclease/phosphatase family protein [Longimicrobium sp.]